MGIVREQPVTEYYSGQGQLMIGDRNAVTGKPTNLRFVGNCTALSTEIAIEKFEHTESQSGNRATDLTIIKSKKMTVKFTCENMSLDNLAIGLYGDKSSVVGATLTGETQTYTAGSKLLALDHPKVSAVVVKTGTTYAGSTIVPASNYNVDADFGTIHITGAAAFTGPQVYFDYTYGAVDRLDVFTRAVPTEKYLRFEGLNTASNTLVLVVLPRVTFDPLPAGDLINDEVRSAEFTGSVLLDPTITTGSQFMIQTLITPSV